MLREAGPVYYESIVMTAVPLRVSTAGSVGQNFTDLDVLADFTALEFLYVKAASPVVLRIGADAAEVVGEGASYPTGFAGTETLLVTIDGTALTVAFTSGDQTLAQVVARINAAAALAGLPAPRASELDGQLRIRGVSTGAAGSVVVTGGTGAEALGLDSLPSALGEGADVHVDSLFLNTFGRGSDAPSRVQVSGQASLSIVAAGRTAA